MFNPEMIERLASVRRADLSRELAMVRLPQESKGSGSTRLKLAVVMSGIALAALLLVQISVI